MVVPPFRALPPGVYFNPTAEECVRDYIKPCAAGVPPATDRVICDVDVYSDSPEALLLGREPGFSRGFDHKWLVLSRCAGKRAVATGGSWQAEQTPKGVVAGTADGEEDEDEQPRGGKRRCFGFYVGKNGRKKGAKTPWLMEEFTALEDGHVGGDGSFVVFCKIYLTPRLEKEDKEKKRQILGDDMVAFDRHGKTKPVRVEVSPELFNTVAQGQVPAPPRVLGHQQGQPPSPAPRVLGRQQGQPPSPAPRVLGHQQGQPPSPAPRVLGHQQGQPPSPAPSVLGYQQGQPGAPPLLRFLGHQHGQAAAAPAVLGDHHGRAMPPRAVPAHHDGQAMLPWGVPAHHHGHAAAAAPHQRFLGYRHGQAAVQCGPDQYCGTAVQPQLLHVPQQGEAMTHTEKKRRLLYGSPAPQPQRSDSVASNCVVHVSPSQEQGVVIQIHDDNQCTGLTNDARKAGAEPMPYPGLFVDLDYEPFSDAVAGFLVPDEFKLPDDDDPPAAAGFDEFLLTDLLTDDSA